MKKIKEHLFSAVFALLFVLILRSSFIESFKIPTGSMIPTLWMGDFIFVNKLAYRLHLPLSEWFGNPIILKYREGPKRGDVVVFAYPKDESLNYVKRVMALPGDWIAIRGRKLYINDRLVGMKKIKDPSAVKNLPNFKNLETPLEQMDVYEEDLSEQKHLVFFDKENVLQENFGPILIPPGQIFVMGDNRDFSNDSRFWGTVSLDKVKGQALAVWMNFDFSFSPFSTSFHPSRIATFIR